MSALNEQIGGSHYKDCKIQPVEFIEANNIGFLEGCVIKRATRHNRPTGKGRQDIEKAIHELQLLLELRYPSTDGGVKNEYGDGWIEWHGGECPVGPEAVGSIKLRNGEFITTSIKLNRFEWRHIENNNDIIAYRLHKIKA